MQLPPLRFAVRLRERLVSGVQLQTRILIQDYASVLKNNTQANEDLCTYFIQSRNFSLCSTARVIVAAAAIILNTCFLACVGTGGLSPEEAGLMGHDCHLQAVSCQGSWAVLGPQEMQTSWVQCRRRRRRNRGEGSGMCWRLGERLKAGAHVLPTQLHYPHQHLSSGDHLVQDCREVPNHVALPSPKPAHGQ